MTIGDKIPELLGIDQEGREIKSSDYRGRKIVLYSYPKANTSGCTAEACSLQAHKEELAAAGDAEDEDIDDEKVWRALKEAQLDEFVRGLPEGLDTGIGERGIRISGGQKQRIGIARALFEDPEILVLDEATSALDNETEAAIMDSINRLHGKKTLIIIAHRLQTIEKCDMVYRVEHGKVQRER